MTDSPHQLTHLAEALLRTTLTPAQHHDVRQILDSAVDLMLLWPEWETQTGAADHRLVQSIRNPLVTIIAYAKLLLRDDGGSLGREAAIYAKRIWNLARHMAETVAQYWPVEKPQTNLFYGFYDVNYLVRDVLYATLPLLMHREIQVVTKIAPELPPVYTSEERLQQILYNLMENAIRYTDIGSVQISANLVNEHALHIRVSDTGQGILPEHLPMLFDLTQRPPDAPIKGVWLALSREFLEAQGGSISVESTPCQGTTVTLTLPTDVPAAVPR
ncbi:MAG: hypothetical protein OHK0046_15230 [Anaerolineae bacterium]